MGSRKEGRDSQVQPLTASQAAWFAAASSPMVTPGHGDKLSKFRHDSCAIDAPLSSWPHGALQPSEPAAASTALGT